MRARKRSVGCAADRRPKSALRGVEWARPCLAFLATVITAAGLLVAAPLATGIASADPNAPAPSAPTTVVVSAASGVGGQLGPIVQAAQTSAVHARVAASGHVDGDLPAASGVVADVTPAQLATLQAQPDLVVTPDESVSVADASFPTATRAPAAVFPQTTGAAQLWPYGADGTGTTVAVLDTGIDRLPDFGKRLIAGVDLSGEGTAFQVNYGHGTFVAGLIAGDGTSSKGAYKGEAPGANLVSVKVAGASGVTDIATVISGINWVVAHQSQYGIGVLNISLGAVPTSSTVLNPLDQAVETAWRAGIVVVTSAGNSGPFNGTIVSPGDDPLAITVGALDDLASTNPSTATATSFSSAGPTNIDGWFKPDLVTSGRSVVSLRAPGSTIDTTYPSAEVGKSNFVGTGTSFSTAITSGAAAIVLQAAQYSCKTNGKDCTKSKTAVPLTPNEVKAQLLGTALAGPVGNPMVDGHGALNVIGAVTQPGLELTQIVPLVPTPVGTTIDLHATWAGSSWNGSSWNGSSWNGSSWNGSSWNGSSWNGSSWNGSSWNGSSWNGSSWNGSSWNGSSWNGSSWNGSSWNGSSWNGSSWNGSSWNGSSWNGSSWS
jgi:serine protease AprX